MAIKLQIKPPWLTDYQREILDAIERFTIVEASTKTGKTFSHIWWLFKEAHLEKYKPGDNFWWVAPVFGQAEIAFNRMKRKVAQNPLYRVNISKMTITTPLETIICFKSADKPDSLYGEDVYAAVFDEFSRAKEEAWFALRSTLTSTRGKCKFIGNCKGRKNWGHKLAMRAKQGAEDFKYFKITAYDGVKAGILELAEIESAKRDLPPHVFAELYLAEASDDGTNPFGDFTKILGPMSNKPPVCFGVDLAKSVDWTVIIGLDEDGRVCYFDRFQKDWTLTKAKLNALPDIPMLVDSTGVGDPIVEDLQLYRQFTEGYIFSSKSKQQLMEGLASAVHQGEIGIPEGGPLQDEMESFEFEYTRTGVRYSAPSGFHDDCVMALGLARMKFVRAEKTIELPFSVGS